MSQGYKQNDLPWQRRVVLQTPYDVKDGVLREHELEERVLVEQEDVLEDLVEVVQALGGLQVLAHTEHVEELLHVALVLDRDRQLLPDKEKNINNEFKFQT